jgi:hypothetical protein
MGIPKKTRKEGEKRMRAMTIKKDAKRKKAQDTKTQLKPNKYGFIELPPYGISKDRYEALRRGSPLNPTQK